MFKKCVFVSLVALLFVGCNERDTQKNLGRILGAAAGGAIGAQIGPRGSNEKVVAIVAGTLLGAWAGEQLATRLSAEDAERARRAELGAYDAPMGQTIRWDNDESGHYGSVTPVREGRNGRGEYCREFHETVFIDGQEETAYGTACKDAYGKWQIVNNKRRYRGEKREHEYRDRD